MEDMWRWMGGLLTAEGKDIMESYIQIIILENIKGVGIYILSRYMYNKNIINW